jgi:hypothetical protein
MTDASTIDPETLLAGMRLGLRMGAEMVRDAAGRLSYPAEIAAALEAEAEALSVPPAPPEVPHAAR